MDAFSSDNWALNAMQNPYRFVTGVVCAGVAGAAIFYLSGTLPNESLLMLGAQTAAAVVVGTAGPYLIVKTILPFGG